MNDRVTSFPGKQLSFADDPCGNGQLLQAQARVTWGDPAEDVVTFLAAGGTPLDEAERLVHTLYARRDRDARSLSLRRFIPGALTTLAAVLFFAVAPWRVWMLSLHFEVGGDGFYLDEFCVMMIVALGVFGFWKAVQGFTGYFVPRSVKLSTDIERLQG